MNVRLILLAGVAAAYAGATLQGGKITLTTVSGTWELSQLQSWNFKYPPKSNKAQFIFKGTPLRAAFNKNQRVLTAKEVQGEAKLEGKTLIPERIVFRGGVTGHDTDGSRNLDLAAGEAVLTGSGAQTELALTGNVKITQSDKQKGSSLVATGSSGTITTVQKDGAIGKLEGPVHVKVVGANGDQPVSLDATCNEVTFDLRSTPYRVVMRGNVVVKGAQPGYEGETRASALTVLLDKDYQPIEMQGSGDPGVTTIQKNGSRR